MTAPTKRIAINVGWGYVPGLNSVIAGTVLAASKLGWEIGYRTPPNRGGSNDLENLQPFDTNPLYAVLQEAIYCQGQASRWAGVAARRAYMPISARR